MIALVVDDNKAERDAVVAHLQSAQFRVEVATDGSAAVASIQRQSPDVVVVTWNQSGPDLLKRVRSFDRVKRSYVIVLLDKQAPAAIGPIVQAGADDLLRRPIAREELVWRAMAPERIRAWAGGSSAILDWSTKFDAKQLRAYQSLGALACADLSQIVGPLDLVDGFPLAAQARAATIPMSLAREQIEIRVSVAVESKCLRPLGGLLLGDESAGAAALDDVIRELANTVGGAVKRAALDEQVVLTTGLPLSHTLASLKDSPAVRSWTASVRGAPARVGIIGEIRERTNERVPIAKLKEGMVVAHDLRNDSGALIIPAGTRLTATAVSRIIGLLGERYVVDVARAE